MIQLSIVIVVKNEERNIENCLKALQGISNDILVVDTGSTDTTMDISTRLGATVLQLKWEGYSDTKNRANQLAQHDWILSLDADEVVNTELKNSIVELFQNPMDEQHIYSIQRKLVFGDKILNHGSVSREFRKRLFNRKNAFWNTNQVHEDLTSSNNSKILFLKGYLLHYSFYSSEQHLIQLEKYAQLSAKQSLLMNNKCNYLKAILSPTFSFIKNYVFRLGFLDGKEGYQFARNLQWYTARKYKLLCKH